MIKRYIVEMRDCTARWEVEADTPDEAIEMAWQKYEHGHRPNLDCSGATVRVRNAQKYEHAPEDE